MHQSRTHTHPTTHSPTHQHTHTPTHTHTHTHQKNKKPYQDHFGVILLQKPENKYFV